MDNDKRLLEAVIEIFREDNNIRNTNNKLFDYFTISQILKEKDIEFEDIDDCIVDGGNDGGIDCIALFIDNKLIKSIEEFHEIKDYINAKSELSIFIIQNKNKERFEESPFVNLIPTFNDIFNYSLTNKELLKNYNIVLTDKIILLREVLYNFMVKSNNISLDVIYATKGNKNNISDGVLHKKQHLNDIIKERIDIPNIKISILGSRDLRNMYIKETETEFILEYNSQLGFNFNENNSYIATVNLKKYFEFVTTENKINENMLESNIRHYQGNVTVNKGIDKTLAKEKKLEFWSLNNGITIIATDIIPLPNNRFKITNPQIVNGLQTTFCIVEYFNNNNVQAEERSVLIKIVATKEESYIDKIIASTNSQTEVRAADLRATDDIQRDIEKYFFSKGYYYDRRKNYYKNMKKERSKIFNIAKTAQYIETILFKRPHIAKSNPTTLLRGNEIYSKIFNDKINIEAYLNACLLYRMIDSLIKEIDKENDKFYIRYGLSISNFTFHIMMISTILYFKKINVTSDNLAQINFDNIKEKGIEESNGILLRSIENIISLGSNDNVVNMAKSKALTDEIIRVLKDLTSNQ